MSGPFPPAASRAARRSGGFQSDTNVVLVGFMGAGKSEVGRRLARRLGRLFFDTDDVITSRAMMSIPDIFRDLGEPEFRRRERAVIEQVARMRGAVIATGGGAIADERSWEALRRTGIIVWLKAPLDVLIARAGGLTRGTPGGAPPKRPLLGQPREAVDALYRAREPLYARADFTIDTQAKNPDEVAEEIHARLQALGSSHGDRAPAVLLSLEDAQTLHVELGARSYPIWIGDGLLPRAGDLLRDMGIGARVMVITQAPLDQLYGPTLLHALEAAGFKPRLAVIPGGEEHKTLDTVRTLYSEAVAAGLERRSAIIALGGGVVGDIAGMVAATFLRGVDFVQVPTSLLAQVDAAVGGKVGVNLPEGKNLVGAFYQPRAVLIDTATLLTLPERELGTGLAEVVKYGFIADAAFLDRLEAGASALRARDGTELAAAVHRSCEIKADIVAQDERETGVRSWLNFGHTFGHGLEAATGYRRFLHGEAVAIGMAAALRLSRDLGYITAADVERGERLMVELGLPVHAGDVDKDAVWTAMGRDKKVVDGRMRLVLLERIGQAVVRDDVPEDAIRGALDHIIH